MVCGRGSPALSLQLKTMWRLDPSWSLDHVEVVQAEQVGKAWDSTSRKDLHCTPCEAPRLAIRDSQAPAPTLRERNAVGRQTKPRQTGMGAMNRTNRG